MRIHISYFSTALIQHGDKFCVCQIDHLSLVYAKKKTIVGCGVLSVFLCEENRIWRSFEVVITKKRTRQILEIWLKLIKPGVSMWSTACLVSISARTVAAFTPAG